MNRNTPTFTTEYHFWQIILPPLLFYTKHTKNKLRELRNYRDWRKEKKMEALRETMKFMMALDYLHERAQERKREQSLAVGAQSERSNAVLRLGRQMIGRGLMALGLHLSRVGKRLLAEAQVK
jgi:hypothetical protein